MESTPYRTVRFADLTEVLRRTLLPMLAASVVALALTYILPGRLIPPVYSSEAELLCLDSGELSHDRRLTENMESLILSRTVLDRAAADAGYDGSYDELSRHISVDASADIVSVSVTMKDRDMAKRTADAVVAAAVDASTDFGTNVSVTVLHEPSPADRPSNLPKARHYLVAAAAPAVIIYLVSLIYFVLGDRINYISDIEPCTGLGVIGEVSLPREGFGKYLSDTARRPADGAYSAVRRAVSDMCREDGSVITVTSSLPDEGCECVALLLANELSRRGRRAIVIETSPSDGNGDGLSEAVYSGTPTEDLILRIPSGCDILRYGGGRPEAASTARFEELISRLRGQYGCIFLVAPAAYRNSSAPDCAALSDRVLIVLGRRVRFAVLAAAAVKMHSSDGTAPTVLINRRSERRLGSPRY